MLAEAVSLDGRAIFLLLVIFVALCLASVAVVVLGCVCALRAGRGSERALIGLLVCVALESFLAIPALLGILAGDFTLFALLPLGALALQATLYVLGRSERGADDGSHPVPSPPAEPLGPAVDDEATRWKRPSGDPPAPA